MNDDRKRKRIEREKEKKRERKKEAFFLIVILMAVFLVFILSIEKNKSKNCSSICGRITGNCDKYDKGLKQAIFNNSEDQEDEELMEALEGVGKKLEGPKKNLDDKEILRKKEEEKEKLKEYKESGEIKIRVTAFYIERDSNVMVVEGMVGNYTGRSLRNPKLKVSFYDENEEVLASSEIDLNKGLEIKDNMIVEFKIRSKDDPLIKGLIRGADLKLDGLWVK